MNIWLVTIGVKMHWQTISRIMEICFIQKMFGRLKADPMARIPEQIEMVRWVLEMGKEVEGKRLFEVGTGHCPIVPIGFFLCGAERVVTVDLHRRLDLGILKSRSCGWLKTGMRLADIMMGLQIHRFRRLHRSIIT